MCKNKGEYTYQFIGSGNSGRFDKLFQDDYALHYFVAHNENPKSGKFVELLQQCNYKNDFIKQVIRTLGYMTVSENGGSNMKLLLFTVSEAQDFIKEHKIGEDTTLIDDRGSKITGATFLACKPPAMPLWQRVGVFVVVVLILVGFGWSAYHKHQAGKTQKLPYASS